ncbi:MAG: DNA repair exonuclease [Gemmatimonadota bacterium]|nr:DNA repair exonuclease [Gemmatimonadota bacterium]
MRLVHLSDLHLGFRQFQRTTPAGINQREADVAKSFSHAIEKVIALRPEIVLVAGDIFHTVRPTNPAILHAFAQFSRLVRELPETIVVMAAGNHELPRSSESTCILRLFSQLGIHVADHSMRRLQFPERKLSILAIPEIDNQPLDWSPDPAAEFNVLCAHAEVDGIHPDDRGPDEVAALKVPAAVLEGSAWNYIGLGHYHVYRRVGPNAYYSGATDYTSTSIWNEVATQKAQKLPGKGIIERDLVTGKQTFHPLPVVREFVDLTPVEGRGLAAADLDAAIAAVVSRLPGGVDGKVVRLVARDVARHVTRELDHKALRELQRRALQFHLDTRRPEIIRSDRSGAPGRRPSLADTLRESLRSRVLTGDVDREALIALGLKYLADAEQVSALAGQGTPEEES